MMTTRTATQRVEQAVAKELRFSIGNRDSLPIGEVSYLMRQVVLAERARLKRGVKRMRKRMMYAHPIGDEQIAEHIGYVGACDDILALWEE